MASLEQRAAALAREECGPGHDFNLVRGDEVRIRGVEWLWAGFIPKGCISIIAGPGGLGKSSAAMSLVSIVTQGGVFPFTSDRCPRGDVAWISGEEDVAAMLAPRAKAAGARLDRLHFITGITRLRDDDVDDNAPVRLSLDAHQLVALKDAIPDLQLLVVDPLSAFLDAKDAHREADVRQVLTPWVKAAEDSGVAVVFIAHHNKARGAHVRDRLSGSTAIRNTARVVHAVLENPEDETERLLLCEKNNLADLDLPGLVFRIEGHDIEANGQTIKTSAVSWKRQTDQRANDVALTEPGDRTALDEAKDFLFDYLGQNGPSHFPEIRKAAMASGVSEKTLRRAKDALGIESRKDGFRSGWRWCLPEHKPASSSKAQDGQGCTLGHLRGTASHQTA